MNTNINTFIPEFIEILTEEGWIEIQHFSNKGRVLTLTPEFKIQYLAPIYYSDYKYNGPLLEIETDCFITYTKPSSFIQKEKEIDKCRNLKKGDHLRKYNLYSRIEHVLEYAWEGQLFSLSFKNKDYSLLPIRFEKDYCLLVV